MTRSQACRSIIVGADVMGEVHARAVRRAGGRTVGVVDPTADGAQRAARQWDADASGTSLAQLLGQVDADLVHICTPYQLHAEQVRTTLAAGRHLSARSPSAYRERRPLACTTRRCSAASCTRSPSRIASTRRCASCAHGCPAARRGGPPGHPQGYQDCFDAFVADVHTAIIDVPPDGLPTFADGHRAGVITDAVLASATERQWATV